MLNGENMIAIKYNGVLFNLSVISPVVARRLTNGDSLGGSRKFLVLVAILQRIYGTEEAIRRTLSMLFTRSNTFNDIIANSIAESLRSDFNIDAIWDGKELRIADMRGFEELLDKVYEETKNVLEMVSKPKTKAEALQTVASIVERADVVVEFS